MCTQFWWSANTVTRFQNGEDILQDTGVKCEVMCVKAAALQKDVRLCCSTSGEPFKSWQQSIGPHGKPFFLCGGNWYQTTRPYRSTRKFILAGGIMTRLWSLFTAASGDEELANGHMKLEPVKTKPQLRHKYGNEANIHLMSVSAI